MPGRSRSNFESLRVYRLAEALADEVWTGVVGWAPFARDAMGKQLIKAADSVGANIAEGEGRGSFADNRRFVRTARGSLNETKHFLRLAFRRRLLSDEQIGRLTAITEPLAPMLNAYLKSIGPTNRDEG